MRGILRPVPVCWLLDELESPFLGMLYLVVDRVACFGGAVSSISNGDVDLRLLFGGFGFRLSFFRDRLFVMVERTGSRSCTLICSFDRVRHDVLAFHVELP